MHGLELAATFSFPASRGRFCGVKVSAAMALPSDGATFRRNTANRLKPKFPRCLRDDSFCFSILLPGFSCREIDPEIFPLFRVGVNDDARANGDCTATNFFTSRPVTTLAEAGEDYSSVTSQ